MSRSTPDVTTPQGRTAFYTGLMLVTLVTLALEVLNARLFSVISWYHLSFFAVSVAMLGMTAGALAVYLFPRHFSADRVGGRLPLYGLLFALSVPATHVLLIRFRPGYQVRFEDTSAFLQLVLMTATAAVPFFFSGIVVAISLTRVPLPIGRIYFFDLLGAGAGCLAVLLLMQTVDPSSGTFFLGALAGLATLAWSFARRGGRRHVLTGAALIVTATLLGVGAWNASVYPAGIVLTHAKGREIPKNTVVDRWNSHSRIVSTPVGVCLPYYWGPGAGAPMRPTRGALMLIDGEAATFVGQFRGDPREIGWMKYDVTSLAYHLGPRGEAAVIGVGGGRDILTALAFGCRHVTGIEVNGILLDLLQTTFRDFSRIAARPDVTLIHDDGRSRMARTGDRFDIVQMSLIDTWAATTAGAMTLSESGLYTVEAWRTFLHRLRPSGVFTVSRWFSPEHPEETIRLISLATATLLDEGIEHPADHIILASAGRIGTLIVSPTPFSPEALDVIEDAVLRYGFNLVLWPRTPRPDPRFLRILEAGSSRELREEITDPLFDLSPPYDNRPFFFNMIRPGAWFTGRDSGRRALGVVSGNMVATDNLMAILMAVGVLVLLSIALPLLLRGRGHGLTPGRFAAAAAYFAAIGLGFMLIEIGLMQRFSVLLGHPIWALSIVLFSMILFTGAGSLVSDRIRVDHRRLVLLGPGIAVAIGLAVAGIQPAIDASVAAPFVVRALVTLVFTVPIGLVLGFCFPVGMRLVARHSERATPWMWGINGGFGVLGGVVAVIFSLLWGSRRP